MTLDKETDALLDVVEKITDLTISSAKSDRSYFPNRPLPNGSSVTRSITDILGILKQVDPDLYYVAMGRRAHVKDKRANMVGYVPEAPGKNPESVKINYIKEEDGNGQYRK